MNSEFSAIMEADIKLKAAQVNGLKRINAALENHIADGPIVEAWPDPIPFDNYERLPEFPTEVLPLVAREMIESVAACNQVDGGLAASIYLGVLSACLQKKFEVDLLTHREPANLFVCPILPSGERKSSTFKALTAPLYEYQTNKAFEMAPAIRDSENCFKILSERLSMLQKKAAKCDNDFERKELIKDALEVREEIAKNPILKAPVFIADDITAEKMGEIMSENGDRLSVMSPEGHIFEILAGLYSDKLNIDLVLKAHAGDPYSSSRIGRGSYAMDAPALSLCLTVQPNVISEIGKNKRFRGRGLLARLLFSVNRPRAGSRERCDKSLPSSLASKYQSHISELIDIPSENKIVGLTPEALAVWGDLYNDTERNMRPGGPLDSIKDWASKLPGAVARISGLLHFATHGRNAGQMPIAAETIAAAAAIGIYFRDHSVAAFGIMGEDPDIEAAKKILEYLIHKKKDEFKGGEILKFKRPFKKMSEILPGLGLLEERGYIRTRAILQKGIGRPTAPEYGVNPKIKTMQLCR